MAQPTPGSLASFAVGQPPKCRSKTPGFTVDVRRLCAQGNWKKAEAKMRTVLMRKPYGATEAYAAWLAETSMARYEAEGVPPSPAKKAKPVAAAGGGASTPMLPCEHTRESVLTLMHRCAGVDYSKTGDTLRVSFNGTQAFEGALDTQENIDALHATVEHFSMLSSTAKSLAAEYATAAAKLLVFLDSHADEMARVGLPRANFAGDAAHADALAAVTRRADDAGRECTQLKDKVASLTQRIEDLEVRGRCPLKPPPSRGARCSFVLTLSAGRAGG
jgi:hypothetical protein